MNFSTTNLEEPTFKNILKLTGILAYEVASTANCARRIAYRETLPYVHKGVVKAVVAVQGYKAPMVARHQYNQKSASTFVPPALPVTGYKVGQKQDDSAAVLAAAMKNIAERMEAMEARMNASVDGNG
jgi:cephalosporin-C deacetylase-like acetyl esterase